jgi:Tfp pilus assembly ATPase PilU
VRSTLADSLRAVVCQYLMKEKTGGGRVLAVELLVNNEAVSNLIRKGKAFQLPSVISTSREQGMQLMDTDLMRLMKEGKITAEDAYVKAIGKKDFEPFVDEEEKKAQAAAKPRLVTKAAEQAAVQKPEAPPAKSVPPAARAPAGNGGLKSDPRIPKASAPPPVRKP